jgi:hypothetical protein
MLLLHVQEVPGSKLGPDICYLDWGIRLQELRNTKKPLSQDGRSPGRDMNLTPSEYETEVLTVRPQRKATFDSELSWAKRQL